MEEEVEEEEEDNSLDEGPVAPTTKDVLHSGHLDNEIVAVDRHGRMHSSGRAIGEQVTSENMWERQEVLAGEDDL